MELKVAVSVDYLDRFGNVREEESEAILDIPYLTEEELNTLDLEVSFNRRRTGHPAFHISLKRGERS